MGGTNDQGQPRVLVVDDDPLVLKALTLVIRRKYEVFSADGGRAALLAVVERDPHVIVCDLDMPGMTGLDFVDELERRHPGHLERVIFITGGIRTARTSERLDALGRPLLEKPMDLGELLDEIAAVAEQRR